MGLIGEAGTAAAAIVGRTAHATPESGVVATAEAVVDLRAIGRRGGPGAWSNRYIGDLELTYRDAGRGAETIPVWVGDRSTFVARSSAEDASRGARELSEDLRQAHGTYHDLAARTHYTVPLLAGKGGPPLQFDEYGLRRQEWTQAVFKSRQTDLTGVFGEASDVRIQLDENTWLMEDIAANAPRSPAGEAAHKAADRGTSSVAAAALSRAARRESVPIAPAHGLPGIWTDQPVATIVWQDRPWNSISQQHYEIDREVEMRLSAEGAVELRGTLAEATARARVEAVRAGNEPTLILKRDDGTRVVGRASWYQSMYEHEFSLDSSPIQTMKFSRELERIVRADHMIDIVDGVGTRYALPSNGALLRAVTDADTATSDAKAALTAAQTARQEAAATVTKLAGPAGGNSTWARTWNADLRAANKQLVRADADVAAAQKTAAAADTTLRERTDQLDELYVPGTDGWSLDASNGYYGAGLTGLRQEARSANVVLPELRDKHLRSTRTAGLLFETQAGTRWTAETDISPDALLRYRDQGLTGLSEGEQILAHPDVIGVTVGGRTLQGRTLTTG